MKTKPDSKIISVRVPYKEWQALKSMKTRINIPAILKGHVSLLAKHLDAQIAIEAPTPQYYSCATGNVTINYSRP